MSEVSMTPADRRSLATPLLLAVGAAVAVAPLCTAATFRLVVPAYPPADWPAAEFAGKVVRDEKSPGRRGKHDWAVVATADGERRMPKDVHDGTPHEGHHVVKRAGDESFDWSDAPGGPWRTRRPAEEPGDSLLAGLGLLAVWCVGLVALFVPAALLWHRRARVNPGSS